MKNTIDQNFSKTLIKGLKLLEAIAEDQQNGKTNLTLNGVAKRLGWNVTTTFRLLSTLQEQGYIERDPVDESYRLGIKNLELGGAFLRGLDLRSKASMFLNELMLKTKLAVHLAIFEEETGDVVYVDKVDSPQSVRMYTYIGIRFPANCTAAGKAILAFLPEEKLEKFIAQGLRTRTSISISSPIRLQKELIRIRELGFSTDKEENAEAIHCVAAPIFDYRSKVIASVSLSGSTPQLPVEDFDDYGRLVKAVTLRISEAMGFRPVLTDISK
jgi:IclR family KDG regulon transcriptional repressor